MVDCHHWFNPIFYETLPRSRMVPLASEDAKAIPLCLITLKEQNRPRTEAWSSC